MAYTPTTSGGGAATATPANPFSNSTPASDFQVVTGSAPLPMPTRSRQTGEDAVDVPTRPSGPLTPSTSSATSMLGDLASMSVGDLAALQDKMIAAGFLAKNNRSGIPDAPTRAAYTDLLATTSRMNAAGQMVTPNDVLDRAVQASTLGSAAGGAAGQYATDVHTYSPTDPARIRLTAEAAFQTAVGKKPTPEQLDKFVQHFASEEMNAQATGFNAQDQAKAVSLGFAGATAPTGNPGITDKDWQMTQQIAGKFGVDPRLLVAIGQHETGWGTLGDGKNGNVLGVGSYDSGSTYKWAGLKNQLTEGAKLLSSHGVYTVDDVAAGKAKFWATDPQWANGVVASYRKLSSDVAPQSEVMDGHQVGGTVAERLRAMAAAAPGKITVSSGTRSKAEQTKLYNDYKAGKGNLAAAPGTSKHEKGLAADLAFSDDATRQWAHANAAKFGLTFPIASESWHVEPIGGGPATAGVTQPLSQSVVVPQPDLGAQATEYAQNADPTETQAYGIGQQFDNLLSILGKPVV